MRSTIQALFDKLQSDLSHYKRLAQVTDCSWSPGRLSSVPT